MLLEEFLDEMYDRSTEHAHYQIEGLTQEERVCLRAAV